MSYWIAPHSVFDGATILRSRAVQINDGIVSQIIPEHKLPSDVYIKPIDGVISPGFFDIQVNGGGNVLFNSSPNTRGAIGMAQAHRRFGTTHILPTVITDSVHVLESACDAILNCVATEGVVGIHIEGPHISADKAGTHNVKYIRPFDNDTLRSLRTLRDQCIPTLITLAPEATRPGQIAELVEMGVVVSIGHSNASPLQVQQALDEGVTLFTHLYNAMSPMQSREAGVVGAAINSAAFCSIICDGHHVAPDMIRLAINARPQTDRMIIVSDAMPTVGGDARFELYGETVSVRDGKLINSNGSLAGAHITVAESITLLRQKLSISLEDCLKMCITHPARVMGVESEFLLLKRSVSDCIVLSEDGSSVIPLSNHS